MSVTGRVYVGKVPYKARERDVEDFFKGYGRVKDVVLKTGYAFVVSFILKRCFFLIYGLICIDLLND